MIEIVAPGPLALAQDLGRFGFADLGVGRSGAADRGAHRLANRLVGNAESAATIEITPGGMSLRLMDAATLAFTGVWAPVAGDPRLTWNSALSMPAGTRLTLGTPPVGLRSYLAVRGGFAFPPVLGSRSTDTLAGLGPAALIAGEVLAVSNEVLGDPVEVVLPAVPTNWPLRVVLGPRTDWFTPAAIETLLSSSWAVLPASNRIGIRLAGPSLTRLRQGELPSEPTLPGAIQVPPDGQPIVLGPDSPVTGGYPVIGVVIDRDRDRLGQLRPGSAVRFTS